MHRQNEQKKGGGGNDSGVVTGQQSGAEDGHEKVTETTSPDKWF